MTGSKLLKLPEMPEKQSKYDSRDITPQESFELPVSSFMTGSKLLKLEAGSWQVFLVAGSYS
jgi:hypothetical protein